MKEGLVCKRSYFACIGSIMLDSTLLEDIDRPLEVYDFNTEPFYELLFAAIQNLYFKGCKKIDEFAVDAYLASYKEQYKIFQDNKGIEYLTKAKEMADLENYDYFYHRLRKYSLLRYYQENNYDIRKIYDYTIVEDLAAQKEQERFDALTEQDIIEFIENELVIVPGMKYCSNTLTTEIQAAEGGKELIQSLMETPDVGLPLVSLALNTIFRGARKGCLYMRSCPSSGGKSRLAASDACKTSVPYYYDIEKEKWVYTGISEPTLYITTEMDSEEIQTILYATVSGVNEDHILKGEYEEGELERVYQAIDYIQSSPLYICHIPDFSITDIKNLIKKYHRERSVDYIFFDYIFTSMRLMSEVGKKSGMGGLKEHQLLLVFVTELKTLCQQLDVFIFTASQLTGEAVDAPVKDQRLLSGAKALANKLDIGYIAIAPTAAELKKIEPILHKTINYVVPNMCFWVYKVRRGRITKVISWAHVDLGTMRVKDLFVTTTDFKLIDLDFTNIEYASEIRKVIDEQSVRAAEIKDEPEIEEETPENNNNKMKFDW